MQINSFNQTNGQNFTSLRVANDSKTENNLRKIWNLNASGKEIMQLQDNFMHALSEINYASADNEYVLKAVPSDKGVEFAISNADKTIAYEQDLFKLKLGELSTSSNKQADIESLIGRIDRFKRRAVRYFKHRNPKSVNVADYINKKLK